MVHFWIRNSISIETSTRGRRANKTRAVGRSWVEKRRSYARPSEREPADGAGPAETNGEETVMAMAGRSSDRRRPIVALVKRRHVSKRHTHTQTNKDAVCRCSILNSLVGRRQTNSTAPHTPAHSGRIRLSVRFRFVPSDQWISSASTAPICIIQILVDINQITE